MKKMRLKKRKKPFCIFLLFIPIGIYFNFKNVNIENSNTNFINNMLYLSNSHLVNEIDSDIPDLVSVIGNVEITNPVSIIDKVFWTSENEYSNVMEFSYIQNTIVDNPKVYIYSTHPYEEYSDGFNVVEASLVLQQKLNEIGIYTIVESRNTVSYMKENSISNSYVASRQFLKDALNNYNYELIIDLHRDKVTNSVTTKTEINGKSYAKIMFVMNKNYAENYKFANEINDLIYAKHPTLTRGIYNKYVDSFNQDLSSKAVLIELGSTHNNSEEVNNSISVLVETIKELLNEG